MSDFIYIKKRRRHNTVNVHAGFDHELWHSYLGYLQDVQYRVKFFDISKTSFLFYPKIYNSTF